MDAFDQMAARVTELRSQIWDYPAQPWGKAVIVASCPGDPYVILEAADLVCASKEVAECVAEWLNKDNPVEKSVVDSRGCPTC